MTPTASQLILGGICLSACLITWALCRAAALADSALEAGRRRYWRTVATKTCDMCGHVWERITRDYDPDLGFTFDKPETCVVCRLSLGHKFEIDLSEHSAADIRRMFGEVDQQPQDAA